MLADPNSTPAQLVEVRRQLNTTAAIFQLPLELFTKVLSTIHADSGLHPTYRQWENRTVAPIEREWIKLFQVCHRWREVLNATPRFWQIVNVHRDPRWLLHCLSRVATLRTSAHIYFRRRMHRPHMLELLHDHRLHIRGISTVIAGPLQPSSWISSLRTLFSHALPECRSITLAPVLAEPSLYEEVEDLSAITPLDIEHEDIGITADILPRLEYLSLERIRPPTSLPLYTRLRTLKISVYVWKITFDQFLDILETCENLEELFLRAATSHLSGMPEKPQPLRRDPITLSRLRTLKLLHAHSNLPAILAYLRLPVASVVRIVRDITEVLDEELRAQQHVFTELLPPERQELIPALGAAYTSVSLSFTDNEFMLSGRRDIGAGGFVELRLCSEADLVWYGPLMAVAFRDLVEIFGQSASAVKRLKLDAEFGEQVDRAELKAVLEAFPQLEELTIAGTGSVDYFWELMSPDPGDAALLCPFLRSLTLGDVGGNQFMESEEHLWVQQIISALEARRERGSRLERFKIYMTRDVEHDGCQCEDEDDEFDHMRVARLKLQGLVGDMVYSWTV